MRMSKDMALLLVDEWIERNNKRPVLTKWRIHHYDGVREFIEWLYKRNKGQRFSIVDRYQQPHDVDKFYSEKE